VLLEREFKSFQFLILVQWLVIGQDTSCQSNFTIRAIARAHLNGFFSLPAKNARNISFFFHFKLSYYLIMINWFQNFLSFNSACNHTRHLNKSDSRVCFNTGRIIYLLLSTYYLNFADSMKWFYIGLHSVLLPLYKRLSCFWKQNTSFISSHGSLMSVEFVYFSNVTTCLI